MKWWAKSFYFSKAWIDTREAYMRSKGKLCERCEAPAKIVHHKIYLTQENIKDTSISLCWDNLEALCQECHNKEHNKTPQCRRYCFDENGDVVQDRRAERKQ